MTTGQKIEAQLDELDSVKDDFIDALEAKGVTGISPTDKYEKLVNDISKIRGVVHEKDVNFYNYDGELLYSYTKEEALALTALPDGISDSLVNFYAWTYTLAELKRDLVYVDKLYIGALSFSKDNALHIFVTLDKNTLSPSIRIDGSNQFSYTIDWGDGTVVTTSKTYSGSNTYSHTYTESGDYEIKMSVKSSGSGIGSPTNAICGTSSYSYMFFKNGGTTNECKLYNSCVKKVIFSYNKSNYTSLYNISLGSYGLTGLINLKAITLGTSNAVDNKYYRCPVEYIAITRNDIASGYWHGRGNVQGLENYDSYSRLKVLCLPGDITYNSSNTLNSFYNIKFNQPLNNQSLYSNMYYRNNAITKFVVTVNGLPGYNFNNCPYLTYLKIISNGNSFNLSSYSISQCPNLHIIDLTSISNFWNWTIADITTNFVNLPSDYKIVVKDVYYNTAVTKLSAVSEHIIKESEWDGKK